MASPAAAFAACLPGLETLLAAELRGLGLQPTTVPGGAEFVAEPAQLLRCGLWLGVASHVLVRLAQFRCRALGELERKAAELPWRQWLRSDVPIDVRAAARRSRLYHTDAIAERVLRAAQQQVAGLQPATRDAKPAARVAVRMLDDVCTVSLDVCDEPLHRRGYRLAGAKAPLREDLAHALVLAAQLGARDAVLDPFCGSGTIAIEAAGLRLGLAPGRLRPEPMSHLAAFRPAAWHALLAEPRQPSATSPINASDRDAGAIQAARSNAERAGVLAAINFQQAALRNQPWLGDGPRPDQGCVITNPPFGLRIGTGQDLRPLYQSLGQSVRAMGAAWRLVLLAHDPRLARQVAIPLRAQFTTRIGGRSVTALCSDAGGPNLSLDDH